LTGAIGLTGPTGRPGLNVIGDWVTDTTYLLSDIVFYDNIAYFMQDPAAYFSTIPPPDDPTYWATFSARGFTGPTGPSGGGGGGGGASITNGGNQGYLLTTTGASTSIIWAEPNLVYSNSILSLTGGFRLTNGFRPPYVEVRAGTSITPAADSYGTYYDIQTSAITGLSIGYPVTGSNNWSNDANAGWLFRNNSGGYLSLTVTYTSATPNIYPSNISIPPDTGVTLLAVYPGGGTNSNYVLF
jgi:hypothetical protein